VVPGFTPASANEPDLPFANYFPAGHWGWHVWGRDRLHRQHHGTSRRLERTAASMAGTVPFLGARHDNLELRNLCRSLLFVWLKRRRGSWMILAFIGFIFLRLGRRVAHPQALTTSK
jgi:hypothetical protein